MKPALSAAVFFLLTGTPALTHRLDEYLQGTILSVQKDHVNAQITLTPGVAIFPLLVALIDTDGNGVISTMEQHAYASRILRDLSLKIDGRVLTPELLSMQFPAIEEMREGRGEIQLEVSANLPRGGTHRKLILENRHQSGFAAYQVNSLVPRDPDIRIVAQNRNYSQSFYELDFVQAGAGFHQRNLPWLAHAQRPLGTIALLFIVWLALFWRHRTRPVKSIGVRPV